KPARATANIPTRAAATSTPSSSPPRKSRTSPKQPRATPPAPSAPNSSSRQQSLKSSSSAPAPPTKAPDCSTTRRSSPLRPQNRVTESFVCGTLSGYLSQFRPFASARRVALRASGMFCALALILAVALGASATAQTGHGQRMRASLSNLCVTEGTVTAWPAHRLLVTDPNVHATLNRETPQDIEAHFVYLGPSNQNAAAPSGPIHHLFCFELFAQDACNLVYVMWRFEPESELAVIVKSNPPQHLHDECRKR